MDTHTVGHIIVVGSADCSITIGVPGEHAVHGDSFLLSVKGVREITFAQAPGNSRQTLGRKCQGAHVSWDEPYPTPSCSRDPTLNRAPRVGYLEKQIIQRSLECCVGRKLLRILGDPDISGEGGEVITPLTTTPTLCETREAQSEDLPLQGSEILDREGTIHGPHDIS